ncbi:MAG TPA: hypothetical protein VH207_14405 [Chthoniobacterales bacterium]|nr:hypothetical protein [Chthoniobacterales bacterium]
MKIDSERFPTFAVPLLALSFLLCLANARGDLIFADSFDYPKGDLDGSGPPPGSPPGQGGWVSFNQTPRVASFGLDLPGVFSAGNSAGLLGLDQTTGDKAVAALGPVTSNDGIVWVGFLIRKARNPEAQDGFAVVSLGNNVTGPSVGIGMLFEKNRYGLDNNTGARFDRSRTAVAPNEKTVWLVTKLDFTTGQEYLWVNPAPEDEPDIADANAQLPMTAAFKSAGFSEIVLIIGYTAATFQYDELRVGTAFADMVSP